MSIHGKHYAIRNGLNLREQPVGSGSVTNKKESTSMLMGVSIQVHNQKPKIQGSINHERLQTRIGHRLRRENSTLGINFEEIRA